MSACRSPRLSVNLWLSLLVRKKAPIRRFRQGKYSAAQYKAASTTLQSHLKLLNIGKIEEVAVGSCRAHREAQPRLSDFSRTTR